MSLSAVVAAAMAPLPAFPDPAVRWRVLLAGLYGTLRRQVEGALRASVSHRGWSKSRGDLEPALCGRVARRAWIAFAEVTPPSLSTAFMPVCSSCR